MGKEADKEMDIHNLESIKIGFSESDFLLVLNGTEQDCTGGYAVTIPIEAMRQITDGFMECGKEYQKAFNKNIGF